MNRQPNNNISTWMKVLLGSAVLTVILTLIGFLADITEITSSDWFKNLMQANIAKWIPHILNIALSIFVIYIYRKLKLEHTNIHNSLESECRLNNNLWKRYVRTLRAIVLDGISTPNVNDCLTPLLDELAKKLPENGVDFKIGLVKPCSDGKFKFLAAKGMDPASVHSMEQKSNWKERKSFFSNGLYLSDEKPFSKYKSGEPNYSNIQRDKGVGTSVSHFVIAIKDPVYLESIFPQNTIGVLSIGIPKIYDFNEEEDEGFYNKVFPIVKSIESILLNQISYEKTQK